MSLFGICILHSTVLLRQVIIRAGNEVKHTALQLVLYCVFSHDDEKIKPYSGALDKVIIVILVDYNVFEEPCR